MLVREKIYDQLHRLNWMFFLMIVILVIILFFSSTIKYIMATYQVTEEPDVNLVVTIKENTIQDVYGEPRPVVTVKAEVDEASIISFVLSSEKYNTTFMTQGYTQGFERIFILPPSAHSTEFTLLTSARGKEGAKSEDKKTFVTKKVFQPRFNIS
ncbi:MAG: hypothetical protein ACE5DM_04120 [Candidatus Nanoarchaeia archaeon]